MSKSIYGGIENGNKVIPNGLGLSRCCHQFLVSPLLGGAGLIALYVAKHLHQQGRNSKIWVPGPGPARNEASSLGLTVDEYDGPAVLSSSKIRSGLGNWSVARRLRRTNPAIVHVHSPYFYRALRIGLRIAQVRSVAHVHLEEHPDGLRWALQDPPDLIITCARFLEDHVRRNLPERIREKQWIVPVPNAVDSERFQPGDKADAKHRIGAPLDRPLLLMLANLSPHKGQETAIRATAMLKQRGVDVLCWLAGSDRGGQGQYESYLNTLAADLNVADRVNLLGQRNDARDLLQAADMFLLPSTLEGLPLSVLEAQATCVPVLAAPTAGVPEIIRDGETGFLIHQSDVEGYASRIVQILHQPELARHIAQRAYANVLEHHRWNSYCENIMQLYHQLSATGSNARSNPVAQASPR